MKCLPRSVVWNVFSSSMCSSMPFPNSRARYSFIWGNDNNAPYIICVFIAPFCAISRIAAAMSILLLYFTRVYREQLLKIVSVGASAINSIWTVEGRLT